VSSTGCSGAFGQDPATVEAAITDAAATEKIVEVHEENNSVHGSLKLWAELRRQGAGGPAHRGGPLPEVFGYRLQDTLAGEPALAATRWRGDGVDLNLHLCPGDRSKPLRE